MSAKGILLTRITSRSPRAVVFDDDLLAVWTDYKTHFTAPSATNGVGAPTSTPDRIGNLYVDTSAGKGYIAAGTTDSTDWKALN